MTRMIEVIVSPQGDTQVQTRGFAGAACQLASQFLEQALGAKIHERLTAEYYAQGVTLDQRLREEGGAS